MDFYGITKLEQDYAKSVRGWRWRRLKPFVILASGIGAVLLGAIIALYK